MHETGGFDARGEPVIVSGVEKGFPSGGTWLPILRGVDLALEPGEFVALTGPSGVGKSTLLHVIAGLAQPDTGTVQVGDQNLAELRGAVVDQFRNTVVGMIYQFHFLLPEFSALENVLIPWIIGGKPRGEGWKRAENLLVSVGLGERLHHHPDQLSGGEQQRTAVARALMNRPRLLLADEPTGNLDEETADAVFSLLRSLQAETGITVLMATHNMVLASRCDRAVRLHEGRVDGGR
jgi:lipoprotein-releasing system ATP-binding protein